MEGATLAGATLDCASLDSSVSNAATADAGASCRRAFRTPPRWRERAEDAEAKIDALRRELAQAREALAAAEAERLRDESKKRSMPGR
jgi:hypothetical protein